MATTRTHVVQKLSRQLTISPRFFSGTTFRSEAAPPITSDSQKAPVTKGPMPVPVKQAPNRTDIWSRSQRSRAEAMTGPRFEQTDLDRQPQPYAAIELIHKQPVSWTHDRVVACNGGGGATGHPRVFINTDKPEIVTCTYCGLPFANEHHRAHLQALPETSYPL